MSTDPPINKFGRALAGGQTAAKIGGTMLSYYSKRPFLSKDARQQAKQEATRKSAATLFQGLSLLRGTALKMAQQLSLETDLIPEDARRELAKAYHQVPPINRALVRKVIEQALGKPPESLFRRFDTKAFAAASLGQVHRAEGRDGRPLAVKVQYPGIAQTIASDVGLLKQLLWPLVEHDHLVPALDELAARLTEEVDYLQEANHLAYFKEHLNLNGVTLPFLERGLCASTVLTATLLEGHPLDVWLKNGPGQRERNHVAQTLNDLYTTGLYELNAIHADPNPGNFIINDDLTVGLVDFGCVKRLKPDFVENFRKLTLTAAHRDRAAHFEQMVALDLVPTTLSKTQRACVEEISNEMGDWFGRLYADAFFDFSATPGFVADGQAILRRFHRYRQNFNMNPEFIFMDRTRYGLLRIFETMGARVKFRNPYEW